MRLLSPLCGAVESPLFAAKTVSVVLIAVIENHRDGMLADRKLFHSNNPNHLRKALISLLKIFFKDEDVFVINSIIGIFVHNFLDDNQP